MNSEHVLNIDDFNELKAINGVGNYFVNGNKIEIELFFVAVNENGKYIKEYGYIKSDSLILFKYDYKDDKFPDPKKSDSKIYVRRKVEGLTGTPDW